MKSLGHTEEKPLVSGAALMHPAKPKTVDKKNQAQTNQAEESKKKLKKERLLKGVLKDLNDVIDDLGPGPGMKLLKIRAEVARTFNALKSNGLI